MKASPVWYRARPPALMARVTCPLGKASRLPEGDIAGPSRGRGQLRVARCEHGTLRLGERREAILAERVVVEFLHELAARVVLDLPERGDDRRRARLREG